ncbi:hypothetical protein C478_18417 [Natrinema thermotolerans DSM 11552]|nr:hypothetical protein C478_18417 [Natrinema thermotolerans DSM 11552]
MRRTTIAAGGTAAIGAGGAQIAPQFSPIGRARAHPVVAVAAAGAILVGSQYLLGHYDDSEDETDVYDTLEKLSIWADAMRNHVSHAARETTLNTFIRDFANFSTQNLYDEAVVTAVEEAQNGASQSEAVQAGRDRASEIITNAEKNIIDDFHLHVKQFDALLSDIDAVEGFGRGEMFAPENWAGNTDITGVSSDPEVTVTYTLNDGTEYQKTAQDYTVQGDSQDVGGPYVLARGDGYITAVDGSGSEVYAPSQIYNSTLTDEANYASLVIDDWPQSEYDNLPEEEKEGIDPPETDANPRVLCPQLYIDSYRSLMDAQSSAVSNVEQFLNDVWTDIQNEDTDPAEFLTGSQLSLMASEEDTFPYAGAQLASLGLPHSNQTVTLEFPDAPLEEWEVVGGDEDESEYNVTETRDGETVRPPRSTGNLYASEMPSSGFQTGSTYDPANLTPTIYYSFHVEDENGNASSQTTTLEERFTVVSAQTVEENEDGELETVDVDEVTYDEGADTTSSPTNYGDVMAAIEEFAEVERQASKQQREIVVELENDGNGGDLFGGLFEGGLGGGGSLLGLGIIGTVVLIIVGYVTDMIPGGGN